MLARMNSDVSASDLQERYRRVRRKMVGASVVFVALCVASALVEHRAVMTAVFSVMVVSEVIVIRKVLRIEKQGLEEAPGTDPGTRRHG
jgi:hypothetical protein